MNLPPLVSVILPVFDDEPTIEAALRSAMTQTLEQIEILVVDDGSTDGTPDVVERLAATDARIRLLRQPENMSAFQARRRGILEARAPYVMFLDGDDELERHAASTAATLAQTSDADMVQFGITLLWANAKQISGGFERRLQPQHRELSGDAVGLSLFPAGRPAGGQLWKYLFRTELLREAYAKLPADLRLYRANDLPVAYLAAVAAQRYVSTPERLYRYQFQRGGSGNSVETTDQIKFQMLSLDAIESIADAVQETAYRHSDPQALFDSYSSARLSVIGTVFRYLIRVNDEELMRESLALLEQRTSRLDMVRAVTRFQPEFLSKLTQYSEPDDLAARTVRSVLLTTSQLTTGGVSGVLLAQANVLLAAGYRVSIAAQRPGSDLALVPNGVTFHEVSGKDLAAKLDHWAEICQAEQVDVVIEHRVLYSRHWPSFALMARACGAATIGWIHNFAGRPTYDLNDLHTFMVRNIPVLAQLVVLSPLDVAFWKLRGIARTAYLPNPPSPMLLEHGVVEGPKTAPEGRIELVWVGRLDQRTKQVRALLDVAEELKALDADFHLTVIGPEWPGLTIRQFNNEAAKRGISDLVEATGPRTGQDLVDALDGADAFVGTSVIEGYQLTLVEAQARGLPVFMYDMPWLVPVQDNHGIMTVAQGDAKALARNVVQVMDDPERYTLLSKASLTAAGRAFDFDFDTLYEQLVHGALPAEYSPEPTLTDAGKLLDLTVFFSERNAGVLQQLSTAQKSANGVKKDLRGAQAEVAKLQVDARTLRAKVRATTTTTSTVTTASTATTASKPRRSLPQRAMGRLRRIARPPVPAAPEVRQAEVIVITRAKLIDDKLRLNILPDRRGVPTAVDAYREVDGVVERHALELAQQRDGTVQAVVKFEELSSRRWLLRATLTAPNGAVEVTVPIQDGALRRSEGPYRMRTFDGTTLQVVRD